MKLPPGKIPIELLNNIVFKNLGVKRKEVVVGPKAGIDGAVIDLGNKSLIVSMDPVTGAYEKIGWLAVNINANDIATFGVRPSFMFSSILLPENTDIKLVEEISSQMHVAAKDLGIAIDLTLIEVLNSQNDVVMSLKAVNFLRCREPGA